MNKNNSYKELGKIRKTVSYPAEYLIVIEGNLSISWSERLAGMSITTTGGKDCVTTTTLKGALVDQAALFGVLNTLHDMNYHLVKVEFLSC